MTVLQEIINPGALESEIAEGYVKATRHPFLPMTIYTYTRACQYEGAERYGDEHDSVCLHRHLHGSV